MSRLGRSSERRDQVMALPVSLAAPLTGATQLRTSGASGATPSCCARPASFSGPATAGWGAWPRSWAQTARAK